MKVCQVAGCDRQIMSDETFCHTHIPERNSPVKSTKGEDSGGSVSYYKIKVECPIHLDPYEAECGDIIAALNLNFVEANIFKEVWRTAAARQGKLKKGHTPIRGAEKIKFFADRNLQLVRHEHGT